VTDLDTGATDLSVSDVIADKGKVSDLKFISGPKSWCNKGGLDMIIVATKPQGDAVLILEDADGSRMALQQAYPKANQILTTGPTYESLSGTCKFQLPPQPDSVVEALAKDTTRKLKLTMKEKKQGKATTSSQYCETVFDFQYVAHKEDRGCPYCAISSMTEYISCYSPATPAPDQPVLNSRKRECSEPVVKPAGVLNDQYDTIDQSMLNQILKTSPLSPNVNTVGDWSYLELPSEVDCLQPPSTPQQQDCSPRKRWCGSGGTCQVIPVSGGGVGVFNDPSRLVLDAPCRRRTVSSNDAMAVNPRDKAEPPIRRSLRMDKSAKSAIPEKEDSGAAAITSSSIGHQGIISGIVNSFQYVVGGFFRWLAGKMI